MSSAAVTHWKSKAQEIEQRFRNFKGKMQAHAERSSKVVTATMLTAGGGAVAAVLDEKFPKIPGIDLDSKIVIGSSLVALSILDMAGDYSEQMTEIGSGILAVVAHEQTKKALSK